MSPAPGQPRALLFDLGRVLVGYDWKPALERFARRADPAAGPVEVAAIAAWMLGPDGPHDALCRGQLDANGLLAALHTRLDPDHGIEDTWLVDVWCDMFEPLEGALDLIDALRGQAWLALVSNTNALHFDHLEARFALRRRFDRVALSHEVGSMKPEPALYLAALEDSGCRPEQAWFVDDLTENVDGARALGMRASRFESVPILQRELGAMGFRLDRSD